MELAAYLGTAASTTAVAVASIIAVVRTFAGRFDEVGRRFDEVGRRFDDVNARFEDMNRRIDDLRDDLGGRLDRMERQVETGRGS